MTERDRGKQRQRETETEICTNLRRRCVRIAYRKQSQNSSPFNMKSVSFFRVPVLPTDKQLDDNYVDEVDKSSQVKSNNFNHPSQGNST